MKNPNQMLLVLSHQYTYGSSLHKLSVSQFPLPSVVQIMLYSGNHWDNFFQSQFLHSMEIRTGGFPHLSSLTGKMSHRVVGKHAECGTQGVEVDEIFAKSFPRFERHVPSQLVPFCRQRNNRSGCLLGRGHISSFSLPSMLPATHKFCINRKYSPPNAQAKLRAVRARF